MSHETPAVPVHGPGLPAWMDRWPVRCTAKVVSLGVAGLSALLLLVAFALLALVNVLTGCHRKYEIRFLIRPPRTNWRIP
jgi:hypothetical protein